MVRGGAPDATADGAVATIGSPGGAVAPSRAGWRGGGGGGALDGERLAHLVLAQNTDQDLASADGYEVRNLGVKEEPLKSAQFSAGASSSEMCGSRIIVLILHMVFISRSN